LQLGKEFDLNKGVTEGHFPQEVVILPVKRSSVKQLQKGTDLMLTITGTADDLSNGTNIGDRKRPKNLKSGF